MLTFVGLGLWDVKDISVKGLEAVREADEVYVEYYTSKLLSSIEEMEEFFGKRVVELERSDLEENSFRLIERAKSKVLCCLSPETQWLQPRTPQLSLRRRGRRQNENHPRGKHFYRCLRTNGFAQL